MNNKLWLRQRAEEITGLITPDLAINWPIDEIEKILLEVERETEKRVIAQCYEIAEKVLTEADQFTGDFGAGRVLVAKQIQYGINELLSPSEGNRGEV